LESNQIKEKIRKYYAECGLEEWERLTRHPYRRLEFDTTIHFLKQHLPEKGLILEAGGGPGRYTIELAKMGYEVVLFDLTPELLEIAQEKIAKAKVGCKVREIRQGSIDDLTVFDDNTFDAITCFGGALSHLVIEKNRELGYISTSFHARIVRVCTFTYV